MDESGDLDSNDFSRLLSDSISYDEFVRHLEAGMKIAHSGEHQQSQRDRRLIPVRVRQQNKAPVDLKQHPLCDPDDDDHEPQQVQYHYGIDLRRFISSPDKNIQCTTALTIHTLGNSHDMAVLPNDKIVVARTQADKVSTLILYLTSNIIYASIAGDDVRQCQWIDHQGYSFRRQTGEMGPTDGFVGLFQWNIRRCGQKIRNSAISPEWTLQDEIRR